MKPDGVLEGWAHTPEGAGRSVTNFHSLSRAFAVLSCIRTKAASWAAFVCLKNVGANYYFLSAANLAASFTSVAPLPMRLRR